MKLPCSTHGTKMLVYWVKVCKIDDVLVKIRQTDARCEAVAASEEKPKH